MAGTKSGHDTEGSFWHSECKDELTTSRSGLHLSKITLASSRVVTAPPQVYLHSNIDGDSPMKLTGIHHLTAVTANAAGNHAFYTQTLGLRLVKKTVNQDDVSAYHLFYADGLASPGRSAASGAAPTASCARACASPARTPSAGGRSASPPWA